METQQQLIGVSRELGGNFANMQGTTRAIYDSLPGLPANSTYRFFDNVQTRPYPFSNLSQNRFETGEALAIESIAFFMTEEAVSENTEIYNFLFFAQGQIILDLYIGNQRVIKKLDLTQSVLVLGNTNFGTSSPYSKAVLYLETPIVIPPLVEFYAEVTSNIALGLEEETSVFLVLQGTGTLLNTQKNF